MKVTIATVAAGLAAFTAVSASDVEKRAYPIGESKENDGPRYNADTYLDLQLAAMSLSCNTPLRLSIWKRASHSYGLGVCQLIASYSFFYKQALNKFNAQAFAKAGYPAFVRQRIQQVATQEATVRSPDSC